MRSSCRFLLPLKLRKASVTMPVDNSDFLDPGDLFDEEGRCDRKCDSQCDGCHTLDNCVAGDYQYGDLLLCINCRLNYPSHQPWRIDPETGEYIECPCEVHARQRVQDWGGFNA